MRFALAAGTWLLLDLLRAWTPTLITIFGRAAETPPELIGGFALGCLAVPVLVVAVAGRFPRAQRPIAAVALTVAVAARVALQFTEGGRPHLVVASVGVVAIVTWLALVLPRHRALAVTGVTVGIAVSVTTHAALGTWGAVWRHDLWSWLLLAWQITFVVAVGCFRGTQATGRMGGRFAWTFLPGLFLAGVVVANAGRASATLDSVGPAVAACGSVLAVATTLVPVRRWSAILAAVLLVGAVAASALATTADGLLPPWTLLTFLVGMPALAHLWQASNVGDRGGPLAVTLGGLIWVALLFAYYAGYDLGYRADWLLVAVAVVIALVAVTSPRTAQPSRTSWTAVLATGFLAAAAVPVAYVGPYATIQSVESQSGRSDRVTVAAWNLRMGYGMDGTFRPDEVATVLAQADVGLLSEVDRGWFLNGGQDQLAILERLLDREGWFGPAADPVWGDAVLLDRGPAEVARHVLPSHGAVTGAQAIAVRPESRPVTFVATHLQPSDGDEGVTGQAIDLAQWLDTLEQPLIAGGDLNLREGSDGYDAIVGTGLQDSSPGGALTNPADAPAKRIDFLFSSPTVDLLSVATPDVLTSDHLPVFATFALPVG